MQLCIMISPISSLGSLNKINRFTNKQIVAEARASQIFYRKCEWTILVIIKLLLLLLMGAAILKRVVGSQFCSFQIGMVMVIANIHMDWVPIWSANKKILSSSLICQTIVSHLRNWWLLMVASKVWILSNSRWVRVKSMKAQIIEIFLCLRKRKQ